MLKVTDLKVNYGGIEAVKGISFDVPEKTIVHAHRRKRRR